MDIFRKVGAVVTAGTLIFSDIAFNAQYVSAENEVFPETMIVENYTGYFQRSFNIDIDGDGIKEKIGYYYIGSKYDHYAISDVYYVYNGDSEPYTLYKRISNDHMNYKLYLVKDNNTGETFIGYIYTDMFRRKLLYRFNKNGEDDFVIGYHGDLSEQYDNGVSLEEYYAYMDNVTFLDQTAYGKGDVDGDADITLSDAGIMLSCYADNAAGLPSKINEIQTNAADMDKDGEITINDAATALSLYSEHAAGIIDTLILPPAVKEDILGGETLYSGDLESVFYLDIDSDGKKETIGRYDNVSLTKGSTEYVYQVYDNGIFQSSFGVVPDGATKRQYVLIQDNNINETYLALSTSRGAAMYGYSTISKAYPPTSTPPLIGGIPQIGTILYVNDTVSLENDIPVTKETISINCIESTRQKLYDYINNLEIIQPYQYKSEEINDEDVLDFNWIFDTYDSQ